MSVSLGSRGTELEEAAGESLLGGDAWFEGVGGRGSGSSGEEWIGYQGWRCRGTQRVEEGEAGLGADGKGKEKRGGGFGRSAGWSETFRRRADGSQGSAASGAKRDGPTTTDYG